MNLLTSLLTISIIILHSDHIYRKLYIACMNNYKVELLNTIHRKQYTIRFKVITTYDKRNHCIKVQINFHKINITILFVINWIYFLECALIRLPLHKKMAASEPLHTKETRTPKAEQPVQKERIVYIISSVQYSLILISCVGKKSPHQVP